MMIRGLLRERPMTTREVVDALGLDWEERDDVLYELKRAEDEGLVERAVVWRLTRGSTRVTPAAYPPSR